MSIDEDFRNIQNALEFDGYDDGVEMLARILAELQQVKNELQVTKVELGIEMGARAELQSVRSAWQVQTAEWSDMQREFRTNIRDLKAERDAALKLVDDTVETLIRAAVKATDKEIEVVPIATENIFGKVKP